MDGHWFVTGLTSWGYDCGSGSVYTRISFYNSWMEKVSFEQFLLITDSQS